MNGRFRTQQSHDKLGAGFLQPGAGRSELSEASIAIGEALSHYEVLDWYGNQVFLGQSCFGFAGAAIAYFGKPIEDLRLEETAYLAALPKAPMLFHPVRSSDRAVERRNFVLSEMSKAGFVSEREAESARQTPLVVNRPLVSCEPTE